MSTADSSSVIADANPLDLPPFGALVLTAFLVNDENDREAAAAALEGTDDVLTVAEALALPDNSDHPLYGLESVTILLREHAPDEAESARVLLDRMGKGMGTREFKAVALPGWTLGMSLADWMANGRPQGYDTPGSLAPWIWEQPSAIPAGSQANSYHHGNGHHHANGSTNGKASPKPDPKEEEWDSEPVSGLISPPDPRVYRGLFGHLVDLANNYTEAAPISVLAHLIVMFGVAINRTPHFMIGPTRHGLNEFMVNVGPSGTGRKGTAGDAAGAFFNEAWPEFWRRCVRDGANTGQGLLYHLRDPVSDKEGNITDEGVTDKRMLLFESEFSTLLRLSEKENNPLTGYLRKFWDGRYVIASMVKNQGDTVTGGHVGVIGHITAADLKANLSESSKLNGFAGRFLWIYSARDKLIPRPGSMQDDPAFGHLCHALRQAIDYAKSTLHIDFDAEAGDLWDSLYRSMSDTPPGRIGEMLTRGPAHVRRLASIYALAEHSHSIGAEHLRAALALWDYSLASARLIFGDEVDHNAVKVLDALRAAEPVGLKRTEVSSKLFGKNKRSAKLDKILAELINSRRIYTYQGETGPKGGRPPIIYRIVA